MAVVVAFLFGRAALAVMGATWLGDHSPGASLQEWDGGEGRGTEPAAEVCSGDPKIREESRARS